MISYVIIGIQVLSNVMVTDVVLLAHKCLGKAEENKKKNSTNITKLALCQTHRCELHAFANVEVIIKQEFIQGAQCLLILPGMNPTVCFFGP